MSDDDKVIVYIRNDKLFVSDALGNGVPIGPPDGTFFNPVVSSDGSSFVFLSGTVTTKIQIFSIQLVADSLPNSFFMGSVAVAQPGN